MVAGKVTLHPLMNDQMALPEGSTSSREDPALPAHRHTHHQPHLHDRMPHNSLELFQVWNKGEKRRIANIMLGKFARGPLVSS